MSREEGTGTGFRALLDLARALAEGIAERERGVACHSAYGPGCDGECEASARKILRALATVEDAHCGELGARDDAVTDAEMRCALATQALQQAIDLAEEGWAYASDYFREKWACPERLAELRASLSTLTSTHVTTTRKP